MNPKMIMMIMTILVVLSFCSVGITIGLRNYWLSGILFILGFILMGLGLRIKKKIL
ncbi:DUF5325 family protein [Salirhabdus sp. Marseille-P4669]|uniref:DUF5325 family protein n=1 Tax=Salirhabdus sp. Marseille-P4669 TaxID=2042310 RepID=UPI00135C0C6C|nr:DUF5325 family protein [Salirhabdus sp. Marseille-P4669]